MIGLTGGIGSGKSLVLESLKRKGIPVLQTDRLGHQLLKESAVRKALTREFGNGILGPRGSIDRNKLGRLVFQDPSKRKKLNALLHPAIRKRVAEWAHQQARKPSPPERVVVEVPLLFEGGSYRTFDGTLSVSAPLALRHRRLLRRGWSRGEIARREKTQWSQARKDRMADWVIFNRGTRKELEYAVDRWLQKAGPDGYLPEGGVRGIL